MAKKHNNDYFETFIELVDHSCEAAKMLNKTLNEFDLFTLPQTMDKMHEIENDADSGNHDLIAKIARDFITPIDREDILKLAHEIDEVTDSVEDVLLHIYMFNISEIRDDAIKFSSIVLKCCEMLREIMIEFTDFRKSKHLKDHIIEMNRLENDGDKLLTEAMRKLYIEGKNPVEIISWSAIYNCLEKCCDACEHVADAVETVIMKNT